MTSIHGISTLEAIQAMVGKKLTEVKETPNGIMLTFEGGVVFWWRQ